MTLQEPTAAPAPETTMSPSVGEEAAPASVSEEAAPASQEAADPFPSGFHYCQSGHRCGCDFGAAEPGDTSTAGGGHPCGWNGWELNADLDHVAQAPPPVEASEPVAEAATDDTAQGHGSPPATAAAAGDEAPI
jgi:hypothetical protein